MGRLIGIHMPPLERLPLAGDPGAQRFTRSVCRAIIDDSHDWVKPVKYGQRRS